MTKKDKPKHANPPRGQTRKEKANAKAKETGGRARFRLAANQAADDVQASPGWKVIKRLMDREQR